MKIIHLLIVLILLVTQSYCRCSIRLDDGTCGVCASGFHLFNGNCFYNIGACTNYHNGNICIQCSPGFLLINNKCSSDCSILCNTNSGQMTPTSNTENCIYFVNKKCLKCTAGYYLLRQTCVLDNRPRNQTIYSQNCEIEDGYGRCTKCINFYYLNQSFCTHVTENCLNYYPNNGTCITCHQGYFLDQQNTCKQADPYCSTLGPNNKCIECYYGYLLNNYTCIQNKNTCQVYDPDNKCLVCFDGYKLQNHKCMLVNEPLCKRFNKQTCTQCAYRAVMIAGNHCKGVDGQCSTFDSKGNCLTCYVGYTLRHNECVLTV